MQLSRAWGAWDEPWDDSSEQHLLPAVFTAWLDRCVASACDWSVGHLARWAPAVGSILRYPAGRHPVLTLLCFVVGKLRGWLLRAIPVHTLVPAAHWVVQLAAFWMLLSFPSRMPFRLYALYLIVRVHLA
jgi:hypothetical protein